MSDADTSVHPDDDLPVYRALESPEAIPGLVDRALERMREDPAVGDFTLEGVEIETTAGLWLVPVGAYDQEEDSGGTWSSVMVDWEARARRAMHEAWGEPTVHTPRLVGSEQQPEGILDYLLVAQGYEAAELWDRGDLFLALVTAWQDEPGTSDLAQILIVLPRELVLGGMAAMMSDDATEHELLMHGEHPLELRRRAWFLSTAYGPGEVRLRNAPLEASRYSLQSRNGTTTVWLFADDGRQLLLVQDPSCAVAAMAAGIAREQGAEAQLILIQRILDGVPDDLRACMAARGETARGDVAEHALEFGLLDDHPVPIITGAFWFDGRVWHTTRGLMELGHRNGFGMDDYGFAAAVRRPYRLGGSFAADDIAPPNAPDRRTQAQQLLDACPYPEQEHPEGAARLGYAIPSSTDRHGIVDAVERAAEAWWERSPEDAELGDDTFRVGGRELRDRDGSGVLDTVLAVAERWTADALQEWTDDLVEAMTARWGTPSRMQVRDAQGVERRTPLTRVMRGTGLQEGPLWWVNGHAVLLLTGMPDPEYSTEPQAILTISRPDAVLELLGRASIWETRLRARVIKNLARLISASDGNAPTPQHVAAEQPVAWAGPALTGSQIVPLATRGGLRAGAFYWVWHFTHDGRGLLTSHKIDGPEADFAEQVELFAGVPEDLLSLVVDREPAGPHPVVTRTGEPTTPGLLGQARSLPDAAAVFYYDDLDWRAPAGMLRRARALAESSGENPLAALYSTEVGVPQLQWAMRAGRSISPQALTEPDYGGFVLSRAATPDEAAAAFAQLGAFVDAALTGSLNDLLDAIVDGPGYRNLLDAALSNPDQQRRREIALWLLGEGVEASLQLSFMTPINVLLANPTLDAGDAALVRRLLDSGADAGFGVLGPRPGGHPLVQLCERDADEHELAALFDALLEPVKTAEGTVQRYDVTAPVLADGRSLLQYVQAGIFSHQRPRIRLRQRLEALAQ